LNKKIDIYLLFFSIAVTFITQTPYFLNLGLNTYIFYIWFIPILRFLIIFKNFSIIQTDLFYILLTFLYFYSSIFIFEYYSGNNYFGTAIIKNYALVIFIFLIGYLFKNLITFEVFNKIIFITSLICGYILTLSILNQIFSIRNVNFNTREYLYLQKNSAAQILLNILIVLLILYKEYKYKIINLILIILLILTIFILRSRSTILCLFVLYFYFLIYKRNIISFIILFFLLGIYIKFNHFINNVFQYSILAGRNINSIDDVSSGRFNLISNFPSLFFNNIFFGRGSTYFESFPLAILIEFGLILSLPILFFLYQPVKYLNSVIINSSKLNEILLLFIISIYVNSLFENEAPFGPGVKSFIIWLLFGYLFNRKQHENSNIN
jgi:hypothetical protein